MEYTMEIMKELLIEQKTWNICMAVAIILTVLSAIASIIYIIFFIFEFEISKWHILTSALVFLITIASIIFLIVSCSKLIPINAELDAFKYMHENLLPIAPVY